MIYQPIDDIRTSRNKNGPGEIFGSAKCITFELSISRLSVGCPLRAKPPYRKTTNQLGHRPMLPAGFPEPNVRGGISTNALVFIAQGGSFEPASLAFSLEDCHAHSMHQMLSPFGSSHLPYITSYEKGSSRGQHP